MKKTLPPPENWQDFESLCKKLFGEIWGCPHTIKKNGRLGQAQAGVDVYGKPKGEKEYWGIQCKGKDSYEDKKLTEKEIDNEIEKAKTFEPTLKTFVFTTTASKDAVIEKYIRIKDLESVNSGGFEIILYCWQDLVDLIQENRDTFNWYMNSIQFKEQYDVQVSVDTGYEGDIVRPKYNRTTKIYEYDKEVKTRFENPLIIKALAGQSFLPLFQNETNHAWCVVKIIVKNTGSKVLEDWKIWLQFTDTLIGLNDTYNEMYVFSKDMMQYRTVWADKDEKTVLYKPLNNSPLIQKDSKEFEFRCKPAYDGTAIKIEWHLLARDFDRTGEFELQVDPEFVDSKTRLPVFTKDEQRTEVEISDYKERPKSRY